MTTMLRDSILFFPQNPIIYNSIKIFEQMLTFDVDFDLGFAIPDKQINDKVHIKDYYVPKASKAYDDSTIIDGQSDDCVTLTQSAHVEGDQTSIQVIVKWVHIQTQP